MRALLILVVGLLGGCAQYERGGTDADATMDQGYLTNDTAQPVPPERGGRPGGTGRAGSTIGGTGSAPER